MKMLRATPILASALLALVAFAPLAQVHAVTMTFNFSKTVTFDNITVTINASITVDTNAKTISGTITVTAVNDTSGQTIFSKTFNFNISYTTSGNNTSFVMILPTLGEVLGTSCMVSASTGASSCLVSKSPDVNHDGRVNILDVAAVASSYGTSNPAYDLLNHGKVDITDIAVVAADFNAPVIW